MILDILKKIKKLKVKELKELSEKLEIIKKDKFNEYYREYLKDSENRSISYSDTYLLFDDLTDALTYCKYHFYGNMLESEGLDKCPCNCHCINCELIPESPVLVRMQEIGKDMTEENVFNEFVEKYCEKNSYEEDFSDTLTDLAEIYKHGADKILKYCNDNEKK
jgi:hypothetical protein